MFVLHYVGSLLESNSNSSDSQTYAQEEATYQAKYTSKNGSLHRISSLNDIDPNLLLNLR
jgi:hypothetical protein